ncbi:MAG: glutathione peroxidase [Chitinophagales bacterium]|nr:MAG: glutathione peroxidase [Chitinophagales bacterium]
MQFLLFFLFTWLWIGCKTIKSRPDESVINQNVKEMKSIYDIPVTTIDGEQTTLAQYKGKKMLIVNVASECGFTPQYADLQALYDKYADKVVVLGFPANNFGGQEPGSEKEIKAFCQKNYGVTFPMFAKISVKGKDMHELYRWLTTKELNGWNDQAPTWNFCKYLISEDGRLLKFYSSAVNPLSKEITDQL